MEPSPGTPTPSDPAVAVPIGPAQAVPPVGWVPPPGWVPLPGWARRPGVTRPVRVRSQRFGLRAGVDRRLLLAVAVCGISFDVAARSGYSTIAATVWVSIVAAALLLGGRLQGWTARLLVAAAMAFGFMLPVRSSAWVVVPVAFAIAGLLLLGASLGADGARLESTFPGLQARIALAVGHLVIAPGMVSQQVDRSVASAARMRMLAVGRGVALGIPVALVIGALLASADPIFRSWFDLTTFATHLLLVVTGAWLAAGLARAASAREPSLRLPAAPSLGTVEAALILGGLCGLYAAFVSAQVVAFSGGGHYVLVTHGLTYAEYARHGFFQLLGCAAITLLVLLGVRACADRAHRVLAALSWLTVALTICVVVVAVRRLQLYEAAYGLTMLRLACLVAAVWIGVVFLMLGLSIPRRGLPARQFPVAVLVSGLLVVGAWAVANPASIVAMTNLIRAEHGRPLDVRQAASLGPDAIPALTARLGDLGPVQAAALRTALCARPAGKHSGTAFNLARATASTDLAAICTGR